MTGGIPSEAVGASVGVLLYSIICLILSALLVGLLINFGERWTYITIFSAFTTLSTLASVVQQLHYATAWTTIKEAQYERAIESQTRKGLAFGGAAQIVDVVLFYIQFYCYNVMALNILFWAFALFIGSWGIHPKWLGVYYDKVPTISKIFTVLFPTIVVGLMQWEILEEHPVPFILVTYAAMFSSLSMGSILLGLILWKYIKTRRLIAGYAGQGARGRWWAPGGSSERSQRDIGADGTNGSTATSNTRTSIYDRALLTRFSIGFAILAAFEVSIIVFTIFQEDNNASIAAAGHPNYTVAGAINDILFFIPGVSASLVSFLVFGTTKSWRQYRDLVMGGCGIRKKLSHKNLLRDEESNDQGLEFERLPSLRNTPSEEELKAKKETESRIRMFAKEIGRQDSSKPLPLELGEVQQSRRASQAGFMQLHSPLQPVGSSNVNHASSSIDSNDLVIQYEKVDGELAIHTRQVSVETKRQSRIDD